MTAMTKRERVDAALHGRPVDHIPVSAWRHFIPEERQPDTLAARSLQFFNDYDWDWIKINPRATYYAEVWGNEYDFDHYEGVRPRFVSGPVASASDLGRVTELPATEGVFAEHLDLVRRIKDGAGDTYIMQTVFSPLSVLSYLIARPDPQTGEDTREARYAALRQMIEENPNGVDEALSNIASTLGHYAAACISAGAHGIFFAIVRLARQGVLSRDEYKKFGLYYDLQVLDAVKGAAFNMLHICGPQVYFDMVASYPVHAINWSTVGQQNPTLGEAQTLTPLSVVGGVDEEGVLRNGSPDEVTAAARESLAATSGEKVLLAPGCSIAMDTPADNLHALRRAAEPA
jgi:uroporphyrinogen decarboxylase